ncbi:MAG: glycoside hydrolase family 3 protein [Ardenticatenaceae bacterium]|nr:glycoside hydrolase family 3 protein [Ardenticatenaceae bacterium]
MNNFTFLIAILMLVAGCQTAAPAVDSVETEVEALLAQMTLEEKIGQMTLIEKDSLTPADVTDFYLGGVLSGGGGSPDVNTPEGWLAMTGGFQEAALATRLGIPILYGSDAVHGHNNLEGATIFPHNIGLGATGNADLMREIGRVTALEAAATGVNWNFAPTVAVVRDIRWGRTYESYGENTDLVTELGTAYLSGLQSGAVMMLGTPKHFLADGGTTYGTATANIMETDFLLDRGDAQFDEAMLRAVHLPPYQAAIDAGARSIMVSFSSWNGVKNHANPALLTTMLKEELNFAGFLVSDWDALSEIAPNHYDAVVLGINAGLDMIMVPYDYEGFTQTAIKAVENGDIEIERIDDAVRRILRVKMEIGLFDNPLPTEDLAAQIGTDDHRALARQAVQESAVLLTHDGEVLPLAIDTPLIFVAGEGADDIGLQSGGWTMEWQGRAGDITLGTTILEGIEAAVGSDEQVHYDSQGRFARIKDDEGNPAVADVGVVVLAEPPYAEGVGDSADLSIDDLELIDRVGERSQKVVVIILSGRPVMITDHLDAADAWIAAWLPGTEGQGLADLLFGSAPFQGSLPVSWPRSVDQLPFDFSNMPGEGCEGPLFPYGHSLQTSDSFVPAPCPS